MAGLQMETTCRPHANIDNRSIMRTHKPLSYQLARKTILSCLQNAARTLPERSKTACRQLKIADNHTAERQENVPPGAGRTFTLTAALFQGLRGVAKEKGNRPTRREEALPLCNCFAGNGGRLTPAHDPTGNELVPV